MAEHKSCSNCDKSQKLLYVKCKKHSYTLCLNCNRQLGTRECPKCQKQKTTENHSNQSDRTIAKDKGQQENSHSQHLHHQNSLPKLDLVETINSLNIQPNQKYKLAKEWQLEVQQIKLNTEKVVSKEKGKLLKQREQDLKHEQQKNRELRMVNEKQGVEFQKTLNGQKQRSKELYEAERQLRQRQHMMEMEIVNTRLVNEKQQMKISMEGEKKQIVQRYKEYEMEVRKTFEQKQELLKLQHANLINQLTNDHHYQMQTFLNSTHFQKKELESKFILSYEDMRRKLQMQKEALIFNHQFEKKQYIEQSQNSKAEMSQLIKQKDRLYHQLSLAHQQQQQQYQQLIASQQQTAEKDKASYEAALLQQKQSLEQLTLENNNYIKHINKFTKSLQDYERESEELTAYIENTSKILVEQFRSLDDTYAPTSNEKLRMTNILLKQYRELTKKTLNPQIRQLVQERQAVMGNFVISEMMNFENNIKELQISDFYYRKDEKSGNKLKMMMEKINIIKSMEIPNVMDSVETLYHTKLIAKIKQTIQKLNNSIFEAKKDYNEFETIKYIDEYYKFKEYLGKEFTDFTAECQLLFGQTETYIKEQFDVLQSRMQLVAEVEEEEPLETIANKGEELKKFIIVIRFGKSYPNYVKHLEKYHNIKYEELKNILLKTLTKNKKIFKGKLQRIIHDKNYQECFNNQTIFKKLKVFDQIFSRQENQYYNFNFGQLHNKLQHSLKNLKDERLNLVDIIITDNYINTNALSQEYSETSFDDSIRRRYDSKIKMTAESRNSVLEKMNQYSLSDRGCLEQFKSYYQELLDIKGMHQFGKMTAVAKQEELFTKRIPYVRFNLRDEFSLCLMNTIEFKNLEETYNQITCCISTEHFLKQHFPEEYVIFHTKALDKYRQLFDKYQQFNTEPGNLFREVLKINEENQQLLWTIVRDQNSQFNVQTFRHYNNFIQFIGKEEASVVQSKLQRFVDRYIREELEEKAWNDGENQGQEEKYLSHLLNKLSDKQIGYYREIVSNRKNRFFEDRQKIIKDEKRKLKQQNFENLEQFVQECRKHEQKHTKYYKVYFGILQEYLNYYYETYHAHHDKISSFLQHVYTADFKQYGPSIAELFKTLQYKTYFNNPQITQLRKNIDRIESFFGQDYVKITKALDPLYNILDKHQLYKEYESFSLLQESEKEDFSKEIQELNNLIITNYRRACEKIDFSKLFELECNRKQFFLELVRIEMYSKLLKVIRHTSKNEQAGRQAELYRAILQKINSRISKIYEEINQFRFYKDELKLSYENDEYLVKHLRKVEDYVSVFKEIGYMKERYRDYINNNYFEGLHLHKIEQQEIINIIVMAWRKEYTVIKKELKELVSEQDLSAVMKYKLILKEKEIINHQNMLCFQEILKEEYDFKKNIEDELLQLQFKLDSQLAHLHTHTEAFNEQIFNKEEKKKQSIDSEVYKIKIKYEKLKDEVKNSFHEIEDVEARANKIQGELNTLNNQMKAEEDNHITLEIIKIDNLRERFNVQRNNAIEKMVGLMRTVIKIENNFDEEIEKRSKEIIRSIENHLNKIDRHTRAKIIQYIQESQNTEILQRMNGMKMVIKSGIEKAGFQPQRMNSLDEILKQCPEITSNSSFEKRIRRSYQEYHSQFDRIEAQYSKNFSEAKIVAFIKQTKEESKKMLPALLIARIFWCYAIEKSRLNREEEISPTFQLHTVQVLAILLLIDAHNHKNASLANRLVQIKAGQGKSRVLGGLCCYLGVKGFEVYWSCYSSYLSERDEQQFKKLFAAFGIENMIKYGPFSEHCESVLNESNKFNFKQIVKKVILKEKLAPAQQAYIEKVKDLFKGQNQKKQILVVDEFDMLFEQKFFGQIYSPGIALDTAQVKELLRFVWRNREEVNIRDLIFESQEYKSVKLAHPHLEPLIANQIASIIYSCNHFNHHPYEIRNHEIQYVENHHLNKNLTYDYSTTFASCYEFQRGRISQQNYLKNLNIQVVIGQLSYAQLPKCFDYIMGVSGTLQVMSEFEKGVMKKEYRVKEMYVLPSIYGASKREVIGKTISPESQFHKVLAQHVAEIRIKERPILIFFDNQTELNSLSKSQEFASLTSFMYKITEKMPADMRNPLINYAGSKNRITLITSAYSRGTDFQLHSHQLNQKGGMHVIQTYFSKSESDYLQILGRTGRQGKKGTFEIVVKRQQMEGNNWKVGQMSGKEMQDAWRVYSVKQAQELTESYKKAKELHEITLSSLKKANSANSQLTEYVLKLNHIPLQHKMLKTIIAIDATNSMGPALTALLSIIKHTITRTEEIIKQTMPNCSFMHKIMAYRNYNSNVKNIIECSEYSRQSPYLEAFLAKVEPKGGAGRQAIEVLFYEIGKMIKNKEQVDQIILIGDAAGNSMEEVRNNREKYGGDAKWNQKIPVLETIQEYSRPIKQNKIPVHSFYILRRREEEEHMKWDREVEDYFRGISRSTKGDCEQLFINNPAKSQQQITHFICEKVLFMMGGKELVEAYRKKAYII